MLRRSAVILLQQGAQLGALQQASATAVAAAAAAAQQPCLQFDVLSVQSVRHRQKPSE
jgi:hypothetical protein